MIVHKMISGSIDCVWTTLVLQNELSETWVRFPTSLMLKVFGICLIKQVIPTSMKNLDSTVQWIYLCWTSVYRKGRLWPYLHRSSALADLCMEGNELVSNLCMPQHHNTPVVYLNNIFLPFSPVLYHASSAPVIPNQCLKTFQKCNILFFSVTESNVLLGHTFLH